MNNRYSDEDLAEFKAVIDKKLERTREQISKLEEDLKEANENSEDGFGTDMMDDSSLGTDVNFTSEMLARQQTHEQQLEKALLRIKNKSYGICVVTGDLIDKRRLMAVPTTTKSLQAKVQKENAFVTPKEEEKKPVRSPKVSNQPKVITKIVKKTNPNAPKLPERDEFFGYDEDDLDTDDLDTDDLGEEGADQGDFDFDQIAAED
jgi:RNA polymerase-binding transcription factor DksA